VQEFFPLNGLCGKKVQDLQNESAHEILISWALHMADNAYNNTNIPFYTLCTIPINNVKTSSQLRRHQQFTGVVGFSEEDGGLTNRGLPL
jgi:hypothetical protein